MANIHDEQSAVSIDVLRLYYMGMKIRRVVAAIIDFYIACFFSSLIAGAVTLGEFNITALSITSFLVTYFFTIVFRDLLFKNASIGKRILRLEIKKTDSEKLTLGDVLKRNVTIIFLVPLEVILIITSGNRLGDIWAKTSIVFHSSDCSQK